MVRTEFDIVNREHDETLGAKKVKIVDGSVRIDASDIEIGAVELKNSTTDDRAKINPDGTLDVNIANSTKDYFTNDVDDTTTTNITYIGKEKDDGTWLILKLDMTSGTVIRGASVTNNTTHTTYADAWTNRTSLTYTYLKDVI